MNKSSSHNYLLISITKIMKESSPLRKMQTRRIITSHSLKLNNSRLGGKYLIFDLIGLGKNSAIYYGVQEETKLQRVFKFYNLKEIQEIKGFREKQNCKRMSNFECQISRCCKSINILKCLDIYQDTSYKIMVYQFCQKSLRDEISKRQQKKISETRAILILKQILSGVKSLHLNANILHNNLKPENILIRNGVYKLIDFGLLSMSDESQDAQNFLIPELMNNRGFNQKTQVWSIGVLFHQILYGQLPKVLKEKNRSILLQHSDQSIFVNSIQDQKNTSYNVINFLTSCLYIDPQLRMTFQELQNHEIFSILEQREEPIPQIKNQFSRYSFFGNIIRSNSGLSVVLPISQEKQLNQNQQLNQLYKQGFHMLLFRRQVQKELDKEYQRLGSSFQVSPIQKVSITHLRSQVNKQEAQIYKKMKEYYLSCLKVDFILNDIIKPLLKNENSRTQRYEVQLFYLILSTCFTAVSRVNFEQKDQKIAQSEYQNLLSASVHKSTQLLYKKVQEKWKEYSQLLTQIQNKITSIIFDSFTKRFRSDKFNNKDIYLTGIQVADFTQKQKVQYTLKYFKQNQEYMSAARQQEMNRQQVRQAFQYMRYYAEIWGVKDEQEIEERYPSLKSYIDKTILPEYGSNSSKVQSTICVC